MRNFICRLTAIAACVLALNATAAQLSDLYQASVPVADRSESARKSAMRAAMRVVLVKLTGDRAIAAGPASAGIVKRAPALAQQFQYRNGEPDDNGIPTLELLAKFEPEALDEALVGAGLPLWSRERPALISWLAVDDGAEQVMVSRTDETGYADVIRKRANLRGVPMGLPLLDTVDAEQLRAPATKASENVLLASERYGADAVLIGAVRATPIGLWEGSWTLHMNEEQSTWTTQGDLPQIVIDEGVDGVADRLAQRYARAAGARENAVLELRVVDLRDVDEFARVQTYLGSLSDVTSLVPSVVSNGQVVFTARVRGGAQALAEVIALGNVLVADEPDLGGASVYRLAYR